MTQNSRRQLLCLVLIVLTIVGCNKVAEFLRSSKDGDIKYCNIKSIQFAYDYKPKVATISYNAHGYPVSAILNQTETGLTNRYYYYDKKDRLVKEVGDYGNGIFQYYRKYQHDAKGRVISDTTYAEGELSPGREMISYLSFTTSTYHYDKYDRVIKYTMQFNFTPPTRPIAWFYEYDEDGNLSGTGAGAADEPPVIEPLNLQYDNKINPNRTNKIWMFLNRDYSVNNSFIADSYNQNKLPLKINIPERSQPPYTFFGIGMEKSEFTYLCK